MKNNNTLKLIEERLQHAFQPIFLEVIDDSDQHIGHAGSKGGAGHYTIKIKAACFVGLGRLEMHRQIYAAVADLMPHKIHALRIKT